MIKDKLILITFLGSFVVFVYYFTNTHQSEKIKQDSNKSFSKYVRENSSVYKQAKCEDKLFINRLKESGRKTMHFTIKSILSDRRNNEEYCMEVLKCRDSYNSSIDSNNSSGIFAWSSFSSCLRASEK